jgi:hypothetical protein
MRYVSFLICFSLIYIKEWGMSYIFIQNHAQKTQFICVLENSHMANMKYTEICVSLELLCFCTVLSHITKYTMLLELDLFQSSGECVHRHATQLALTEIKNSPFCCTQLCKCFPTLSPQNENRSSSYHTALFSEYEIMYVLLKLFFHVQVPTVDFFLQTTI